MDWSLNVIWLIMPQLLKRFKPYGYLACILLLGIFLRLIWGCDIEFKEDEAYTFSRVINFGTIEDWQWVGMKSSVGLVNPGLTVWIFILIGKILHVQTPPELARGVQLLNSIALILVIGVAFCCLPKDQRKTWFWSAAIAAVNPLAIVLHRKIWPQSVVPIFSILLILCWFKRSNRVGAFFWGIFSSLLGQFHMAGFFFSAGLVGWTYLFDRWKRICWRSWLIGSLVGVLPMLPWIFNVVFAVQKDHSFFNWIHWFMFKYWNYWVVGAFGTNISYSLGEDFYQFIKYPIFGSFPTYIAGFAEVFLCFSMVWLFIKVIPIWKKNAGNWRNLIRGQSSETSFLISAGFWGSGLLITLAAIGIYNHYLLVVFPLQYLWISQSFLRFGKIGERILFGVLIAQTLISVNFLYFIHKNGGSIHGDYGTAYSHQGKG